METNNYSETVIKANLYVTLIVQNNDFDNFKGVNWFLIFRGQAVHCSEI